MSASGPSGPLVSSYVGLDPASPVYNKTKQRIHENIRVPLAPPPHSPPTPRTFESQFYFRE